LFVNSKLCYFLAQDLNEKKKLNNIKKIEIGWRTTLCYCFQV
jgi:hypothetical protein